MALPKIKALRHSEVWSAAALSCLFTAVFIYSPHDMVGEARRVAPWLLPVRLLLADQGAWSCMELHQPALARTADADSPPNSGAGPGVATGRRPGGLS